MYLDSHLSDSVGCGLLVQISGHAIGKRIVSREWFKTCGIGGQGRSCMMGTHDRGTSRRESGTGSSLHFFLPHASWLDEDWVREECRARGRSEDTQQTCSRKGARPHS